jgi:hypothetical protein
VKIDADNQTASTDPLPDDPRNALLTIRADIRTNASQARRRCALI